MDALSNRIVKNRKLIILVCLLLLIPSVIGFIMTGINYDVLSYLPKDIESMKGQDIMLEQFGKGAFAIEVTEGLDQKSLSSLKEKIQKVDGVESVISYSGTIPEEMLPDRISSIFYNEEKNENLMFIFFSGSTGEDKTLKAVENIRGISGRHCFMSGVSSVIEDIKIIVNREMIPYIIIAVILCSIVLSLTMDSFLIPFIFLSGIGISIIYNLGTNLFLGEISFLTLALTAVLQLAVTMDYSIFLYNSFKEEKKYYSESTEAMSHAITNTFTSIVGSSTTTVAGFLALCFMTYKLGANIGLVMAKGVVIGIILCVTLLPSMILVMEERIERTKHRDFMPDFDRLCDFILDKHKVIALIFAILIIPAFFGYRNTDVYYNLIDSLPDTTESLIANSKLDEDFNMGTANIVMYSSSLKKSEASEMISELKALDGMQMVFGVDSMDEIPDMMLPDTVKNSLESRQYKMLILTSSYKNASDEVNRQLDSVKKITKKYDKGSILIGEAASTKDLIEITDRDFRVVNYISIAVVFLIIAFVFKSVSIPVILIAIIEFAIFVNMGIPFYLHTKIPFISSVVIGTIQLGSTVDYAILMTTRYKREREEGNEKEQAVTTALKTSIKSILVSAMGFFVSTLGVALYSQVDLIGSICTLLSRGALISMVTVILVLPTALLLTDGLIIKTTYRFNIKEKEVSYNEH